MPDLPEEAVHAAWQHVTSQPLLWQYVSEQDVRDIVEAAAPAIAAQVLRDLLAAAQSCTMCGEIHQRHPAKTDDGNSYMSWGHPEDGHAYFQASQEAAAWLARQIGEAVWKTPEVLSAAQQADIEEANAWLDRSRAEKAVAPAEVIAQALSRHPWNSYPHAAHREHQYDSACGVCRGDVEALANVALYALADAGMVVVSAEDLRTYLDRGTDLKAEVEALRRLRAALPERTTDA